MVRKYKKKPGSRMYKNYSEEVIKKAVEEVKSGKLSQNAAARKYKINRTTLLYKVHGSHEGKPGHPAVLLPEKEQIISQTLGTMSDWEFPITKSGEQKLTEKLRTF